jgi:hypothetical protein
MKDLQEALKTMEENAKKMEETHKEMKKEAEKKTNQHQKTGNPQKNQTPNSNSNPNSTTPGTKRNPYYKGPGGANGYREQDAGGYGGGGGDDSSNNSDEDGNNSDEDENRDEIEDEDETYGGNRNGNTEETVDEEGVDATGTTIKRNIIQLHFNQADYITTQCLKGKKISEALDYFVNKEALTRNDLLNVNGAYRNSKKKPQYSLRVAPWFEKKYKEIMRDIGMPNAADEEMNVWFNAWREARKDGEWHDDDIRLQISNGYDQLIETKFQQLKNLLDAVPVLKGKAHAKKLTPQDVKKWMQQGRVLCYKRAIYWKTFAKYMITNHTLHPEIKEAIETRISSKTFSTEGAWTITVYIEKIILEM